MSSKIRDGVILLLVFAFAKASGRDDLNPVFEFLAIIFFSIFYLSYYYFFSVVEASSEPKLLLRNSKARKRYDALREDLSAGDPSFYRAYTRRLSLLLDATDRFFGDAGKPNRRLSSKFKLRTAWPLWTASSFDTCLVLALIYPIVTVFFFWVVTGEVGPAEAALDLHSNLTKVERYAALFAVFFQVAAMQRSVVTNSLAWALAAFLVAVALATTVSVASAGAIGLAQGAYFGSKVSLSRGMLFGVTWILAFTAATVWTLRDWFSAFLASSIAVIFAVTMFLNRTIAADSMWKRFYMACLVPGTVIVCYLAAKWLSNLPVWNFIGPLLLFGALLTVLNAPFDWLSLGLTRFLLRRSLEKGGWAPLYLSLIDAVLASFLTAALVPVMVVGIQFFDRIALHYGGHPILPLKAFFEGIEATPLAPKFWWAYSLLLSTMVPSFLNLCVGGFSVCSVSFGLSPCLLRRLPAEGPVDQTFDRYLVSTLLTVQVVGGILLGLAAQAFLAGGIFLYVFPEIGLELLHIARWTEQFDIPSLFGL